MFSRHRVSRGAIDLLKRFEGYRQTAVQLPDGRWMIGYGHTLTAREGAEVSQSDAEALLLYDLITVAHVVNEGVFAPLSQNQFDALCSFAFNIGIDNFRRSQMLKRHNAGDVVQAACAMELWRKADFEGERIVIDALVRRRAAEKALFLTPAGEGWVPAPSPLLRPVLDLDALSLVPSIRPTELSTALEGARIVVSREDGPDATAGPSAPEAPLAPALTAATEAVTSRLSTLFADPGEEPELTMPPLGAVTPEAPPIGAFEFLDEAEPELVLDKLAPAPDRLDAELEIPKTPFPEFRREGVSSNVNVEMAPFEFIPARTRPAARRKEPSLVWDLLLALLGLSLFGFAVFWGAYADGSAMGGLVTPLRVAWLAGLSGIAFLVIAVFRLLQRLGRQAERD